MDNKEVKCIMDLFFFLDFQSQEWITKRAESDQGLARMQVAYKGGERELGLLP